MRGLAFAYSQLSIASASPCIEQTGNILSPLILASPEGFTAPLAWPHLSISLRSRGAPSLDKAPQSKHCAKR